jgi:hypothetical protein
MAQSTQKIDQAILKVAYILTTISSGSTPTNVNVFRKIAKHFDWYNPGSSETDNFVTEIISTTKQLSELKVIYTEEEYFKAFLNKLSTECDLIKCDSEATARKAIVIWLSVCLADNKLSDAELKAIKALQIYLNPHNHLDSNSLIPTGLKFAVGAATALGVPSALGAATALGALYGSKDQGSSKSCPPIVSDEFITSAIDSVKTLGTLAALIEKATDENEKKNFQESFDILQKELHSMILNG